jgi:lysine decarboxylase/arginine decarboxylase
MKNSKKEKDFTNPLSRNSKRDDQERIEIIIIDDTQHVQLASALNAAIKKTGNAYLFGLPLRIKSFAESNHALEYLESNRWRYVKIILLDFELKKITNDAEQQELSGNKLIEIIKTRKPEIEITGISGYDPDKPPSYMAEDLSDFRTNVKNLLYKLEFLNPDRIIGSLTSLLKSLKANKQTPFFDEFKKYVDGCTQSWHVPGHNRGQALYHSKFGRPIYDFFGHNTYAADHDVPKKFGSIFDSEAAEKSVIYETQRLVTKTFGTGKSFFVTNGNSASNNIILLSLLKPGDDVLVARSCHKSIHYAMVLSGAKPTYLNSAFSSKYEILAPPSIDEIEKELKKGKFRLVIVTGCSYEGLVMDIRRLNEICKKYKTELFVDEAWYGYSNFHPQYQSTSATRLGVPYVTQSAHKMMSSFRQGAFIHINNENFDFDFFSDVYNTFTSTSPQYQIIASMDVAAMQMRMEGYELIDRALEKAELFKEGFTRLKLSKIKLLTPDDLRKEFLKVGFDFNKEGITCDPLKLSFDISELGINVKTAFEFIRDSANVDLIKYTRNCIQVLFTIGTAFDNNKPAELAATLKKLEKQYPSGNKSNKNVEFEMKPFKYAKKSPRDFFYGKRSLIELNKSKDKFSSTLVTPYPPGIPLLVPGEKITSSHINYLKTIGDMKHISVHGLKDGKIYVHER